MTGASAYIPSGSPTHQQIYTPADPSALSLAQSVAPVAPNLYHSPLERPPPILSVHSAALAETSLDPFGSSSSQTAFGFAPVSVSLAASCLASGSDWAL